ncbi:MAG: hypothetical protein V2J20_03830, partial [Wenzhouxiangella sp.]|nr:hypothetical protein [Wenzhouxiangella sp.]
MKRTAGVSIALGSTLILITIAAELVVGWIGVERSLPEAVHFVRDHWDRISLIWSAQVLGYVLWILGFLVLLRSEEGWRFLVWAASIICGFLVIVAFLITLGAYPPALDVLHSSPELFAVVRGLVNALYRIPGGVLLLILLAV